MSITAKKEASKRPDHRQAMLSVGAKLINLNGASGVRLRDVALELGLSRNALYHYVNDSADLVMQCFTRSCEATRESLSLAMMKAEPRDQIAKFIALMLAPLEENLAIVHDYSTLPEPHCSTISDAFQINIGTLTNIIRRGQIQNTFRSCDPAIAARGLYGVIEWTRLWFEWVMTSTSEPQSRERAIASITDWVLFGSAAKADIDFSCSLRPEHLLRKTFNPFDKRQAQAHKRLTLVHAASKLFNSRGFGGVSMDDIGAEVGATKGAVYSLFKDKASIIEACFDEAFKAYQCFIEAGVAHGKTGLDKMLITFYLNCLAQTGKMAPLVLQPGMEALSDVYLTRTIEASSRVMDAMSAARDDKSMRSVDKLVTVLSAGAFFGIQRWQHNSNSSTQDEVADQLTTIFGNGLCHSKESAN